MSGGLASDCIAESRFWEDEMTLQRNLSFVVAVIGIILSFPSAADLNKCVDPATKKAYFTDTACPVGSNREKSVSGSTYSAKSDSSPTAGSADPRIAKLIDQRNEALKNYEKAKSDYRFAERNYTDQNAINAAYNWLRNAEKQAEAAHQNYLNAADPAQAAVFQQQRNASAIREQQAVAQEAARQAAIRDENRRQQEAAERNQLAQQVEQLRQQQAATAEAARRAEQAANNAAANANAGNRGPTNCYQKMMGQIVCF